MKLRTEIKKHIKMAAEKYIMFYLGLKTLCKIFLNNYTEYD